jgi:hypothetical protein
MHLVGFYYNKNIADICFISILDLSGIEYGLEKQLAK